MPQVPVLKTDRLILRAYNLDDIPDLTAGVGEHDIAANTLLIPHPYSNEDALEFITKQRRNFEDGKSVNFAITLESTGRLVGGISLDLRTEHERAEMGYWIAKPHWGKGYATEAARALLKYAFEDLKLNRVWATFMTRNPASGRVMEKLGMRYEGCLREHVRKWDNHEDLGIYSILRGEFQP